MDKGIGIILGITVATVVALVGIGASMTGGGTAPIAQAEFWGDTRVSCLPTTDSEAIVQDIRSNLTITVDGESEIIPSNIGVSPSCFSEIHTIRDNGEIEVKTTDAEKTYTLADFFAVRGEEITREGFLLEAIVGSDVVDDPRNITLANEQEITLTYTTDPNAPVIEESSPEIETIEIPVEAAPLAEPVEEVLDLSTIPQSQ